jgi:hypothetical protein
MIISGSNASVSISTNSVQWTGTPWHTLGEPSGYTAAYRITSDTLHVRVRPMGCRALRAFWHTLGGPSGRSAARRRHRKNLKRRRP